MRARLLDGSGVFIKAVHASTLAAGHHCREIAVTRRLRAGAPVPRLLHAGDDGEWVTLVFEEIPESPPAQPWRREDLDRVLAAIPGLVTALAPAPADVFTGPGGLAGTVLTAWPRIVSRRHAGQSRFLFSLSAPSTGETWPAATLTASSAEWSITNGSARPDHLHR